MLKNLNFQAPPLIMGILNVTPDSFSDGGRFFDHDAALRHCETLINEGADIIDVGGESTRPGAQPVSPQAELERIGSLVEVIKSRFDVPLSIDTRHTLVMQTCLQLGVECINDVQALQADGALDCVAKHQPYICLMHMQGTPQTMQTEPQYVDVVQEVKVFLKERMEACLSAGIQKEKIIIDPGFCFGKNLDHNYALLNRLHELKTLDCPVLVGLSRKSMFGKLLNLPAHERLPACLSATAIAVYHGAKIIRTHDVQPTRQAAVVAYTTLMEGTHEH